METALAIVTFGVVWDLQEFSPRLIVQLRGLVRPPPVCLTAVLEFDFRAFTAVGADNEQHRKSRSVSHGGRRFLVYQISVAETLDGDPRLDRGRLASIVLHFITRFGARPSFSITGRTAPSSYDHGV